MLNEEKIKKMRKLAAYESGAGKEDLSISNYYRSDYIGLALIKNFFFTTIAYGLLVLVYFGGQGEYLMNNIHKMNLVSVGAKLILLYVVMIIVYSIFTYIYCSVKFSRAQKGIEAYYQELSQLKKMYDKEEKRMERLTRRRKDA
ncbi:MAG: hypothetical protein ACI4EO_05105 [Blautia sp.]